MNRSRHRAPLQAHGPVQLPISRVRDVMKLDADMETMQVKRDALLAMCKATEMFVQLLTEESYKGAAKGTRITYQDVAVTIEAIPAFDFLSEMIPVKGDHSHIQEFVATKANPDEQDQTPNVKPKPDEPPNEENDEQFGKRNDETRNAEDIQYEECHANTLAGDISDPMVVEEPKTENDCLYNNMISEELAAKDCDTSMTL